MYGSRILRSWKIALSLIGLLFVTTPRGDEVFPFSKNADEHKINLGEPLTSDMAKWKDYFNLKLLDDQKYIVNKNSTAKYKSKEISPPMLSNKSTVKEVQLLGQFSEEETRSWGQLSKEKLTGGKLGSFGQLFNQELTEEEDLSLGHMLVEIARKGLKECSIVVAYDNAFGDSATLRLVLQLDNAKQVLQIGSSHDFHHILWKEVNCRGYIFLLRQSVNLIDFASLKDESWDFQGRYVIAGVSRDELETLVASRKGTKTQHIAAIIKGIRPDEWGLYINWLYTERPVRHINIWRKGNFTSKLDVFPDKMANLREANLKVVTFEWEPSVLYYRDENGTMKYPFGIDIEVVSALSSVLNFSLEFVEPPPGELWGVATENGSWNGMVGKLSKKEGDIGVGNLFLTLGRLGVVDYSAPYDAEVSCFLVRSSSPDPRWKSLALPFQPNVWLALLVGLLISGPLLFCLAKYGYEKKAFQSALYSGQYAYSVHFRQSQSVLPVQLNTQIFICFLWLYVIIITVAYGTNLTAYLTVIQTPIGMESIKELHKSGSEVSGLGGFFKGALASSVDPYLQALANRFAAYGDLNLVWPKVQQGEAAYLHNKQFLEFVIATQFTNKGVSSMRIMKECFSPYNIAMALQRNSPLKRKFDQVISWMLQSGLVRRWFIESFRQSRKIKESAKAESVEKKESVEEMDIAEGASGGVIPLSTDHLQGIFFILGLGYILATLVFIIEMCLISRTQIHRNLRSIDDLSILKIDSSNDIKVGFN